MAKDKETTSQVIHSQKSFDGLSGLRPETTQSGTGNSETQQSNNASSSDSGAGGNEDNNSKK